jgi:hypothetical protein
MLLVNNPSWREIPRKLAVLVPSRNEGLCLPQSIRNIQRRLAELPAGIEKRIFIGINGSGRAAEQEIQQARLAAGDIGMVPSVEIIHVDSPKGVRGKEATMNCLGREAGLWGAEALVFSDAKVYRAPGSIRHLLQTFWPRHSRGENPRYLGATVLPYPIEVYQKVFPRMSATEAFYYRFFEIDKNPVILGAFPKTHLRGTFFITGSWEPIAEDVVDDFYINRSARYSYGHSAVALDPDALGFVIPRLSFEDHFAVRLFRTMPTERVLDQKYPHLVAVGKQHLRSRPEPRELFHVQKYFPGTLALYQAERAFMHLERELIHDPQTVGMRLEEMKRRSPFVERAGSVDPRKIWQMALADPTAAAEHLLSVNEKVIMRALSGEEISYGPRVGKSRSLLPLDFLEAPIPGYQSRSIFN